MHGKGEFAWPDGIKYLGNSSIKTLCMEKGNFHGLFLGNILEISIKTKCMVKGALSGGMEEFHNG